MDLYKSNSIHYLHTALEMTNFYCRSYSRWQRTNGSKICTSCYHPHTTHLLVFRDGWWADFSESSDSLHTYCFSNLDISRLYDMQLQ